MLWRDESDKDDVDVLVGRVPQAPAKGIHLRLGSLFWITINVAAVIILFRKVTPPVWLAVVALFAGLIALRPFVKSRIRGGDKPAIRGGGPFD